MQFEIYNHLFWPACIAIVISKPISDFFWLKKFKHKLGFYFAFKKLITELLHVRYIAMVLCATAFQILTYIATTVIHENYMLNMVLIAVLTGLFIAITIITIKSIVVAALVIITFANFLLISFFRPLTIISDLATLNNLLSNLITTFNYVALAAAAVGLVWQFGRANKEDTYGTVSTMFYSVSYIVLNMFMSFIFLFVPTVNRITQLAS